MCQREHIVLSSESSFDLYQVDIHLIWLGSTSCFAVLFFFIEDLEWINQIIHSHGLLKKKERKKAIPMRCLWSI